MIELLRANLDYTVFALAFLAALAVISIWLKATGRSSLAPLLAWTCLVLVLVGGWFLVDGAGRRERYRLRTRIEGLAPTYADELRRMGHAKITLETPPDDAAYLAMVHKQIRWLELNHAVADIYTFRKRSEGNRMIIDSETDYDHNGTYEGDREQRTPIGEVWDRAGPYLNRAHVGA